jgi:hypothetical protein
VGEFSGGWISEYGTTKQTRFNWFMHRSGFQAIFLGIVCPDLTNSNDKIPSKNGRGNIMITKWMKPTPMTEDQLEYVKKEITRIYFSLISKTGHDPMIVELMKLSALSNIQKRYETGEPWLLEH